MDAPSLYKDPVVKRFGAGDATLLEQHLAQLDASTTVIPSVLDELLLNPDGTTRAGQYRYTSLGFMQIAQQLGPGISTVIPDLAGCHRRPESEIELFDLPRAITIYNSILQMRFDLLRTKRIVRYDGAKLIEGVLGPRHRFAGNLVLYQQIVQALRDSRAPVALFVAQVIGRRLSLWYRSRVPMFTVLVDREPQPFWSGFYFCNGEAGGDSLRGTEAVFNTHGCCLGSFNNSSRMRHYGQGFDQRAGQLFGSVVSREPAVALLQTHVEDLLQQPLNVELGRDGTLNGLDRLVQILVRRGIPQNIANDVSEHTICVGHDSRPVRDDVHGHPRSAVVAGRTGYDLFCSLIRCGKRLDLRRRERVEQVAYDLLTGKIKL